MVLVDTSVWIRFLAGKEPYYSGLDRLLALGDLAGHELVYGELLIGDRGSRKKFLNDYTMMWQAQPVAHAEVVEFVWHNRLQGLGAGWIDVHLLASAIVNRMQLWTADATLTAIANKLGISFEPLS